MRGLDDTLEALCLLGQLFRLIGYLFMYPVESMLGAATIGGLVLVLVNGKSILAHLRIVEDESVEPFTQTILQRFVIGLILLLVGGMLLILRFRQML
jgi:hypothetical protein